jgi:plastocyanin
VRVRSALRLLLPLLAAVLLAACAGGGGGGEAAAATPVKTGEVVAKDNRFDPVAVEVPAGATVTWSFQDGSVPHNVKGDGFESETVSSGTFRHRFDTPGTYDYRCTLHAGMDGRVVVTGS